MPNPRVFESKLVDQSGAPFRLVYDVTEQKKRRRPASGVLQSEDRELNGAGRRDATSQMRDLVRNFSLAKWAINKHLDFVASFTFRAKTGEPELDRRLQDLMEWWGRASNFDVANRHGLPSAIRIAEARRTVDGDVFCLKLNSGKVQWIEGDRIRSPYSLPPGSGIDISELIHGVLTDAAGKSRAYCVCRRGKSGSGFEFERFVGANNLIQHAWFERFDQIRGITPLTAGFNAFQDVYENVTYALMKSKVAQLFGLVVKRDSADAMGAISNRLDDGDDETESEEEKSGYEIDFGRGPFFQELDPGDQMEFLENKTPSTEFQDFMTVVIGLALKAIDIPFSFYDESWTNFFGSKAALALYLMSCKAKRAAVQELLRRLTVWRLAMWIVSGELVLPAGLALPDLKFEWIPAGMPWWDQSKEVAGDIAAIGATLRTRTEIRKERYGDDWHDVVRGLAEEEAFLEEMQVTPAAPVVTANVGVGKEESDNASRK